MHNTLKIIAVILGVAFFSANLQAGVVPPDGLFEGFESFDMTNLTIPTASPDLTGFPSAGAAITTATASQGTSSLLAGGRANGENPATAYFSIALNNDYDFYASGNGLLTFDMRRFTGPVYRAAVLAYSNGTQVGQSSIIAFSDNDWSTYGINLTTQATDVDELKIYVSRIGTDTSAAYICVDNIQFLAVPEPATLGLLSLGGLLALRRKRN